MGYHVGGFIVVADKSYTDITAINTALSENPVTVMYILATPVEIYLSSEEIISYLALRTNEPTTTIMNDCGAYMVVKYCKANANGESIGRMKEDINHSVKYSDVVDNLLSEAEYLPLSAKQGKVLKDTMDALFAQQIYTASYTIAANGTVVVDVPVDNMTDAGYTMVAITPIVNSSYVSASVKATESEKIQILLKSSYSSSLTASFTVRVLRMKVA